MQCECNGQQQLSTSAHNVFSLNRNAADQCPPCFDCHLAIYPCINFGNCSDISGRCDCPIGFGLNNCSQPLCGGLATPTRHARLPDQAKCDCLPGWTGVHCNVCETDRACDSLVPGGQNGTCYNSMHPVKNNHVLCDVTNKAIVDTLKGKKPQLTLNCDKESSVCEFQFWAAEVESFYCKMQECSFTQEHTPTLNITTFECPHMQCRCFPERLLCESNGLDFTEWFNDAQEGPNGPGTFTCEESITDTNVHRTCRFSEPHMNEVISQFFGDPYIKLECPKAGECMHYTQIPGYTRPEFNSNFSPMLIALMSVSGFGLVVVVVGSLVWLQRKADASHAGYLHIVSDDPQSEAPCEEMMSDHVPCTIQFRNLSYAIDTNRLQKMVVLEEVQGVVRPGQVMAIMGGSGAGKTTLLDILARKNKSGMVSGEILINGRFMDNDDYKSIIGYVDQEDTLMDTLTVYESILYSALLRLPESMTYDAKIKRVEETMLELDILAIANRRIGSAGKRGLSGGEKRRVSIACELVTSPSILFLDEPTSGLDTYNAYNVIESLVSLARDYQRTVIFTIHQPRSNIYALFDQLVLLAKGRVVYSGSAQEAVIDHFVHLGFECPLGYNIADYLVDLTMHVGGKNEQEDSDTATEVSRPPDSPTSPDHSEQMYTSVQTSPAHSHGRHRSTIRALQETLLFSRKSRSDAGSPCLLSVSLTMLPDISNWTALSIQRWFKSVFVNRNQRSNVSMRSTQQRQRASWWIQFKILSGRSFKNLYRNPDLLRTHYIISVVIALICGFLFWKIDNTLAGFQNRLGVMFFICAVFGFGCLSSMQIFAAERLIFVRERANRYYSPITYFIPKILFDMLPLRVLPPLILGLICYHMIGLRPDTFLLLRFLLVLVLFNLTAAAACLAISIIFKDVAVASLIATLVMLFEMLFGGLLLNKSSIPPAFQWMQRISFFNYAFEALVVNEVNGLSLLEEKFGLKIDVPGSVILQAFGLDALGYWEDVKLLGIMCMVFIGIAFIWLQLFVRERR
ncbi:hypothetical protein BATDEDRAFT_13539 [Batrachochytrium dendrobatidis JAM81]|uniref:ABC transporter domain-containing protein n=1 Tax=Batrachochytrium dendrobatidis (strain JAM81 / FGSC 10211) TaxID=684364 RepID=F4PA73_BATDJ|nr:uncharacterized protein BATDEDRAFT_13539 [Batrachochytrium dendrobatidis JAM81]EGF77988.1 hypothetical protein BATDEDRAFT_13539 [Batrachochytrium dendrobatidis JAM81]|eukprot:XP_006681324.1 hypothetical protein BATDEDRAFT_13539 [Batrachochytrium dendrobatidis JAM81]